MPNALVTVDQVAKRYGDDPLAIDVIREVTFAVPTGQFVSITGARGCGKSTLLNLMAGLEEPTRGRITIAREDLATLSPDARSDLRLRRIGFVFQTWNLLPMFTAFENVTTPLEFLGVGWREARRRATSVLEAVGVPPSAYHRLPTDLSPGEQQRTAIARALVADPQLLLADEPAGNLDSATGRAVLDMMSELNRTRRVTIVMATHSAFAATYGHRTIELADGRIVRDVAVEPERHLHLVSDDDPS